MSLYQGIDGIDSNFANKMQDAFNKKDYQYLKTPYNNSTLGKTLTNLFYGGSTKNMDEGLAQFIIEMAHLDTHLFIQDMEISNINIISNLIYNKIDSFFQEAKFQKNLALETKTDQIIEIFSNIYNERTVFDFLQKHKTKFNEKEVAKLFPLEMKNIIEKAKQEGGAGAAIRKKVQEENLNLVESYNLIIQFLCVTIQESITKELTNIELDGITLQEFILEILSDESIVSVKRQGASRANEGYTLASYSIDTQKLREKVAKYIVDKDNNTSQDNGIIKKITETDVKKILDEGAKDILNQYNLGLKKYLLVVKSNSVAWEYYENNLLASVTQIAIRDWEQQMKPSPVSELYKEIERANNASIHAAEWNKTVVQIENLEKRLTQTNSLSSTDKKEIENIVNKFNKTDKDDAEMIKKMENFFLTQNYAEGINVIKKRLVSKRAGYIANFNGGIGEIFITTIISKIAPKNWDVYQKGSSKNLYGQSAHADITIGDIGIQSKVYEKNNIKLYENTKVTFKLQDALRYLNTTLNVKGQTINEAELQAFRFFLLNNTILKDLDIIDWTDNDFVTALNLRLANFIRYSDGLTDLENIKNNFFIINFNIVPASVIFLRMADMFKEKNTYDRILIDFQNHVDINGLKNYSPSDGEESKYLIKNLLSYLSDSFALFKSFELNLNDIGADIF